jgi:hypothetical protein
LAEPFDTTTSITLGYEEANLNGSSPTSGLRIWKKDASTARISANDLIPSGSPKTWSDLANGSSAAGRTITLYIEVINVAGAPLSGKKEITVVAQQSTSATDVVIAKDAVNVFLASIEVKINNTDKITDDLVAVSNGTDPDLSTDLNVTLSAGAALPCEANITMKTSDGDIKFETSDVNLLPGVTNNTKMWGKSQSSAKNSSTIKIAVKSSGGEVIITHKVTVFKGVRIEFGGNYYINVDTRDVKRRPWDGRNDPKPNSKGSLTGQNNIAFDWGTGEF